MTERHIPGDSPEQRHPELDPYPRGVAEDLCRLIANARKDEFREGGQFEQLVATLGKDHPVVHVIGEASANMLNNGHHETSRLDKHLQLIDLYTRIGSYQRALGAVAWTRDNIANVNGQLDAAEHEARSLYRQAQLDRAEQTRTAKDKLFERIYGPRQP